MLAVLWVVVAGTAKNRVRVQWRRLRRPRYLLATLAGLGYFWFFFGRRVFITRSFGPLGDEARHAVAAVVALVAVAIGLSTWAAGKRRAELSFTEAEIQLLFPGPTHRRSLLLYKIARSLILVGLTAAIMTLLFGARISGSPLYFLVGAWLALSTWSLHETLATLTRARLLLWGKKGWAALAGLVAAMALGIGALAWSSLKDLTPPRVSPGDIQGLLALLTEVWETPLGVALYPLLAPMQVALAPDARIFLAHLPAALALLGIHVALVLWSDVAFEEASVEAAQKRAKLLDQRRARGRKPLLDRPKVSSRLSVPASGRPWWGLAWKNLVAARRLLASRLWTLLLPFVVMGALLGYLEPGRMGRMGGAALACAAFAGFLVVMGPGALRTDFRMDHPNMDILRTLPLTGLQVVVGQLLGPLLIVTFLQWAAIGLAVALAAPLDLPWLTGPLRLSLGLCAALLGPLLTACGFAIQNAAALLFPTWSSPGLEAARGFEGMGQRLLTLAGSLLVLVVGLLPAAAVGGVVLFLVWVTVGPLGAPLAALAAGAVLAGELALAAIALGRVFDGYDVSEETS